MADRFPKSVYEIYVPSFYDSNNDGIGDLNGIAQKLDYLKDLGIEAIKLSPIWQSPGFDGGYDISDYLAIEKKYGTLTDFKNLINATHDHGLRIIVDYVPNHTSHLHPWFIASRSSLNNPYRDFYIWRPPKPDGSPPSNWLSHFGTVPAWEFDQQTGQYYLHSFLKEQPDLNWRNPKVVTQMLKVLKQYFDWGADGVRIDAINHLIKDERFLDEPPNPDYKPGVEPPYYAHQHIYSTNQPEIFVYLKRMCEVVSLYPRGFMVSETYVTPQEKKKYFQACDNSLSTIFHFDLIAVPWDAKNWGKTVDHLCSILRPGDRPMWSLGNHDRVRLASRIGQKQACIAAMLELTIPGIPVIYYGDEVGMEQQVVPPDKIKDPLGGRDGCRTPMKWPAKSPLRDLYKQLLKIRNQSAILQKGTYRSINLNRLPVIAFIREYQGKQMVTILNFSDKTQSISLPYSKAKLIISTSLNASNHDIDLSNFGLLPYEGYLTAVF